jgi:pimeloyl-ACP methyl ester carboxylesterase
LIPLVPPEPIEVVDAVMDDGAVIRIRRHGNPGGLRVVLSHGNGFAADAYYPFWREFLDRCDVILFDFRNHGQNPFHTADGHRYRRLIADLVLVRESIDDAFGHRPALGLFHSLSARANMKRALTEGWLWEAMVLFDPPMVPAAGHPLHAATEREMHVLSEWSRRRPKRFDDPAELAHQFAETRGFSRWVPGAHDLAARSVLREERDGWVLVCPGELEARIYEGNGELGIWPRASDFERPALVIASDPEAPGAQMPATACRALADECGFPYVAIPGTGHFLQIEEPRLCAREVFDFAARIGMIDAATAGEAM